MAEQMMQDAAGKTIPAGYKQTEVGVIPEDWSFYRLGDLEPYITSGSRGWAKYYSKHGDVFVRITNMSRESIYLDLKDICYVMIDAASSEGKRTSLEEGDVLVSITADIGICSYIDSSLDKPAFINQHIALIRFNHAKINSKFIAYYLSSHQIQKLFKGSTDQGAKAGMNLAAVRMIKTALPTLQEQTAIARFLDYKLAKINRFIRKKKQLIKLLNEQRAAIINQAVTKGLNHEVKMKDSGIEWLGEIPEHWELRKLKYVANFQSGEMITSETIADSGNYPVYGGGGFRGYTNEYTNEGHHVLIGRQGALCGNIKYAEGKFWASEHAIVTYPKIIIETFFLGEILRVANLGNLSQTAAQPGISIGQIKNVKVPIPPLSEQQKIVSHIEQETAIINTTISKIEKEIALVEEYKTALIAEAVTGKIDVRTYQFPTFESEDEGYEELEEELALVAEESKDYQTEEME